MVGKLLERRIYWFICNSDRMLERRRDIRINDSNLLICVSHMILRQVKCDLCGNWPKHVLSGPKKV